MQQVDQNLGTEYYNYNFEITLFLSLNVMDHKTWSINRVRRIVGPDPFSNNIVDIVLVHLSLNTKQKIIIHKIMYHTMCNQITPRLKRSDQFLFIIRSKGSIDKSQVIKAISQAYDIIGKGNSIFITVPTETVVNNISGSTLHIVLEIGTRKIKETVKG